MQTNFLNLIERSAGILILLLVFVGGMAHNGSLPRPRNCSARLKGKRK